MITAAETAHLGLRPAPIFLEGKLAIAEAQVARDLGLRDGQIIQATVQAYHDRLQLLLAGGRALELPRELPAGLRLSAGDQVLFRVQVLSNGSIVLQPQVTTSPTAPPTALTPTATAMPGADRTLQLSLRPPEMNALAQLLRPDVLDGLVRSVTVAFPEVAARLQEWMRLRASMAQLTPERLQQLFQRSGWMTEANLAQGQGAGLVDLKSTLRQLLRVLQQSNADGAHRVSQALDDIESRQLLAADSLAARDWVFSIMLPFRDADPVALQLSRPKRAKDREKAPYVIHLHTRNRDLGELWLQTCISDQTNVDMIMWALRQEVVERARQRAGQLGEGLEEAGLQLTRLQVVHGPGPRDLLPYAAPDSGSVVDVRT
ncbi:hypothetical protein [Limnohabitans sp.]|jgi:hypothetical protein|uniref:hypothetical protein n=1 Tax=Limnohabitans sp. TaxID=1907725 RepID=UPI00391A4C27